MAKKEAFHGSDLERIEKEFGIRKEDIINFAANVNPLGISPLMKEELSHKLDVITRYPDRDYTSLRESIGNYCHISPEHIVVGNGSTELISIMAQFIRPQKALILGPTYSEYAREIGLNGGDIDYLELKEEQNFVLDLDSLSQALENHYDLFVVCNPNNPTSGVIDKQTMRKVFSLCQKHHTFVMVDETYVEFTPDIDAYSCARLTGEFDNFICLRGVSKFYAAPGLRLGYAITSNVKLLATIRQKQNPWSVNSLAETAGIIMYQDADFQEKTRSLMHREQKRMYDLFAQSNQYKPYPVYANFILLKILDEEVTSAQIFEQAIRNRFMIRDCSSFPFLGERFIRFCFMNPEDNDRLANLLLSI